MQVNLRPDVTRGLSPREQTLALPYAGARGMPVFFLMFFEVRFGYAVWFGWLACFIAAYKYMCWYGCMHAYKCICIDVFANELSYI